MESPLKLGNDVEDPRRKNCLDRISSLPDELLGHMLSFLPTRSAVRTSILSTTWRYIFTLTSCLSFDDKLCFRGRQIDPKLKTSFEEYVYNVLELHQTSPIEKFSLVCRGRYHKSDLNAWVSNAVKKRVPEIHYKVGLPADMPAEVPDGLVMCETLVTLIIVSVRYYGVEIPLLVGLPNLKFLHLANFKFVDGESMQRLFSGCKLLENLTLKGCRCFELDSESESEWDTGTDTDTDYHVVISSRLLKVLTIEDCIFQDCLFEIDAPNLVYLTYAGNFGVKIVPSWKNSCSLVKAELMFKNYKPSFSYYSYLEYDRDVFKAAAYKTVELSLLRDSIKVLHALVDVRQMPDFPNLSRLHLRYFPYDSWEYVTSLLKKSPQLETIIFDWGGRHCYCNRAPPASEPSFPCYTQVIEIRNFCGHTGSLPHLGLLLKHARDLKKLIIREHGIGEKLEISKNDLLMLPTVSSDLCIELKSSID